MTELLKGWGGPCPPPPLNTKKNILVCILKKRNFNSIYTWPPSPKNLQIDPRNPKIDNKKIYKKKCTYLDNKKNLWKNHKSNLSKNNNNNSITNPSKKNHKNPINFTQFLPLTWELYTPLKWLHPHSHRDNCYAIYWSLHPHISLTLKILRYVNWLTKLLIIKSYYWFFFSKEKIQIQIIINKLMLIM